MKTDESPTQKRTLPDGVVLKIERGDEGLWYGTSEQVPGLLVAGKSPGDVKRKAKIAISELAMARETENTPHAVTKGPWIATHDGTCVDTVKPVVEDLNFGHPIATCSGPNSTANARAIAALPDLIEAAENIVGKLESHESHLVNWYSKLGSDDEVFEITAGEARALRSALNLIKGDSDDGNKPKL